MVSEGKLSMKFKSITIENFRNFADITAKLGNKNGFFGMNDIWKVNFLFALRYLFGRERQKRDLIDSETKRLSCLMRIYGELVNYA
jgi:predicted ATP-dependent endonuclease of OLD family